MRNLLGRLHDRAPRELELIAHWWEVDLRGPDRSVAVGHLYRVLSDPWAFALAWEHLLPTDRVVLELLTEDERALTLSEIAARVDATPASVRPSLERLYRAGYLYRELEVDDEAIGGTTRLFLPRETAHLTTRLQQEQGSGMPASEAVEELLARMSDRDLVEIAEHMGRRVMPAVALRPELLGYLTPRLGDPDRIHDALQSLPPGAAELWTWLIERDASPRPSEARDALALSGRALRSAIHRLAERGLLWRGYSEGLLHLVVPDLIRHPSRPPAPPPPDLDPVAATDVAAVDWVHPYAACWDLLTLLRAVAAGQLTVGGHDLEPGSPAVRRLAPRLWRTSGDAPPTGYLPFLAGLAAGLGLISAGGAAVEPARVKEWTRLSFPEQVRRLFDTWQQSTDWAEGESREALQVWGTRWPVFRSRLLDQLGPLDTGTWVSVDSFAARFAACSPDALGPNFTAAANRDDVEESVETRRRSVLELAATITLTTAADWLGIVTLSRAGRRQVLASTPLGGWLLDGERPSPEETALGKQPLVVQPSFDVLLLRPTPRRVWALSAFTETVTLDRVSIYRLTRQSLERGLASGLSLAQMTGFLERHGEEPLPETVAYAVEEWAREYRRVSVRRALLIEPDERSSLPVILGALQADGLRVERLPGERLLALVAPGDDPDDVARRVAERLRALGQTPRLSV